MLAYTFNRLLTEQAVIQRNQSQPDAFGADGADNWQPHLTVACRLVWDKSSGVRSANRTYVSPARTVPVSEGFLVVALGTDITENDRITSVLDHNPVTGMWDTYVAGPFTITAVISDEDHTEVYVERAHLGA